MYHDPKACVRTTRSISAGSPSPTVLPREAMPALLTRMLIGPRRSSACATIASQAA